MLHPKQNQNIELTVKKKKMNHFQNSKDWIWIEYFLLESFSAFKRKEKIAMESSTISSGEEVDLEVINIPEVASPSPPPSPNLGARPTAVSRKSNFEEFFKDYEK